MSDLPTPKYHHGSVVYRARTTKVRRDLPCPDCLGTQKWKILTPAGSEMEADCQRCSGNMNLRGVPSLVDFTYEPVVDRLTVGSIEVKSRQTFDHDDLVRYMCDETGIGSGSVYNERDLHDSEEAAMATAQALAAAQKTDAAKDPERIDKVRFQYLTIKDAAIKAADTVVWQSWYRYQNLRDDIEASIDGADSLTELREGIQRHLDWDKDHRGSEHDIFEKILVAVIDVANRHGDEPELQEALSHLPRLQESRRTLMALERSQEAG